MERTMNEKNSFIYYNDWAEQLLELPEQLRLKIDDAVKRYVLYGEEPTDREVIYSMFGLMRKQIERDFQKWRDRCEKNRDNINQRWNKQNIESNTDEYNRIESNTNHTDNDNVNDNVIDRKKNIKKKSLSSSVELPEYVTDDFKNVFTDWLLFKKEKGQTYKPRGMKSCYNKLLELSGNDPQKARQIVEQSTSNNYAGLFPLKLNSDYGTNISTGHRQTSADNIRKAQTEHLRQLSGTNVAKTENGYGAISGEVPFD